MSKLNGVFIIPTGLGCSIGGDAGANIQIKLISKCISEGGSLIINPNSCNASDINEMPDEICWYTEGSIIDRMMEGEIALKRPKVYNKILVVSNSPVQPDSINAMNASLHTLGADITPVALKTPLVMKACIREDGTAGGVFSGADELVEQIKDLDFDVLAIHTPIECEENVAKKYWNGELEVNPWGGIEAQVSKYLATKLNKNLAHSPIEFQTSPEMLNLHHTKVSKIECAPEIISKTYSHCMFKGLHKAPRIVSIGSKDSISQEDIDFVISPMNCFGRLHNACIKVNIPVIVVRENTTCLKNFKYNEDILDKLIFVDTYTEAAGVVMCMKAGIDYRSSVLNFNRFKL